MQQPDLKEFSWFPAPNTHGYSVHKENKISSISRGQNITIISKRQTCRTYIVASLDFICAMGKWQLVAALFHPQSLLNLMLKWLQWTRASGLQTFHEGRGALEGIILEFNWSGRVKDVSHMTLFQTRTMNLMASEFDKNKKLLNFNNSDSWLHLYFSIFTWNDLISSSRSKRDCDVRSYGAANQPISVCSLSQSNSRRHKQEGKLHCAVQTSRETTDDTHWVIIVKWQSKNIQKHTRCT